MDATSYQKHQRVVVNRRSYDHGCDEAAISDPSDKYINQPERGPLFHTDEFMNGYTGTLIHVLEPQVKNSPFFFLLCLIKYLLMR
jgi:hypothetical protein